MQLREYIPSDCAQLAELFYQTVHSVNAKDYTKEQLDAWATGEVDLQAWDASFRAHRTIVATESGKIVGFGDMDETGYLDRLYVHKDYQGQGVASAICDLRRIGALCSRKDDHNARLHYGKAFFPASRIPRRAQTGSDSPRRCAHEFCDGKAARKGKMMMNIPDPNAVFPNEYKTSCFIKNVVTAPNISVGDYTYYDDAVDPTGFERNNVLFNYPEFGDHLVIGRFCQIASGTKFIMGPANHRISSATTYPFNVFGGAWTENTPPHMAQLPRKGDMVIGNDVWIGRESIIMPGVKIGDGAIIAAYSVVVKDVPAYTVYGGNPTRFIKERFDAELKDLLLRYQWWNLEPEKLVEILPVLCDPDLEKLRRFLRDRLAD